MDILDLGELKRTADRRFADNLLKVPTVNTPNPCESTLDKALKNLRILLDIIGHHTNATKIVKI
jgi:hypothetical protein